jgi:hypothetical protein
MSKPSATIDAKRDEYRKYLEKEGILDALTKSLVNLEFYLWSVWPSAKFRRLGVFSPFVRIFMPGRIFFLKNRMIWAHFLD